MPRFLVRKNCEYSIEIDAPDEDAAIEEADATDDDKWEQSWSEYEAEEVDDNK